MAQETENIEQKTEIREQSETEKKERDYDSSIVFIGNKPFMNYVTSVLMQLNSKDEVTIKARGKFITRAVDVAEVSKKRYQEGNNLDVKEIKISSEEFENKEGRKVNVSIIEITLKKK